MHILLTAATAFEIQPVVDFLRSQAPIQGKPESFVFNGHRVQVLISGIGIMSTTYSLTEYLHHHSPGYIFQAGIAGSFSGEIPVPSLVLVKEEIMGDLGAAEKDGFNDLFDLGFLQPNEDVYTNKSLINPHTGDWARFNLPFVKSITINEITTQPARISLLQQKYQPVVESMEGAALHYVCLKKSIPFMQLRAISNKVGERDKTRWKIKEAIAVLNEEVKEILHHFPG